MSPGHTTALPFATCTQCPKTEHRHIPPPGLHSLLFLPYCYALWEPPFLSTPIVLPNSVGSPSSWGLEAHKPSLQSKQSISPRHCKSPPAEQHPPKPQASWRVPWGGKIPRRKSSSSVKPTRTAQPGSPWLYHPGNTCFRANTSQSSGSKEGLPTHQQQGCSPTARLPQHALCRAKLAGSCEGALLCSFPDCFLSTVLRWEQQTQLDFPLQCYRVRLGEKEEEEEGERPPRKVPPSPSRLGKQPVI